VPEDRGSPAGEVPAELREQYEQIAARAAAAGRALDPTPVLEIATRARHDSRVFLGAAGAAGPVRVRLSRELVTAVPAERAWTIAHELGHALRHQEGARLQMPTRLLAGSALAGTASAAGVLAAVYAALHGSGAAVDLLFAFSMLGAVVMVAAIATVTRRDRRCGVRGGAQRGRCATATLPRGPRPSPARGHRAGGQLGGQQQPRPGRDHAGAPGALLPTVLRSHPRPGSRRRAGQAATR